MRPDEERLEKAAAALRACSRAYTRRNLHHAWLRLSPDADRSFAAFEEGVLARRLARGPLDGLLARAVRWDGRRLGREWDAYFPRSILLVDSPDVLGLFIASGVITTARMSVVCIDGSPGNVVDWLRRGFRAGHRAPIGYLHDSATAFYPFAIEPLASIVLATRNEPIDYVDLGLPFGGALARRFPLVREAWTGELSGARKSARVTELEELPPCALLAYATRRLMARVAGDPMMAPLVRKTPAAANDKQKGSLQQ